MLPLPMSSICMESLEDAGRYVASPVDRSSRGGGGGFREEEVEEEEEEEEEVETGGSTSIVKLAMRREGRRATILVKEVNNCLISAVECMMTTGWGEILTLNNNIMIL